MTGGEGERESGDGSASGRTELEWELVEWQREWGVVSRSWGLALREAARGEHRKRG